MASALPDSSRDLLRDYHPHPGVADELLTGSGELRPVWSRLISFLSRLSDDEVLHRFAHGDQYLRDAGVFFRQNGGGISTERDWPLSHVPVLIAESEWDSLKAGIVQRAELLEQVMADLYGPGRLVSDGLLPPQLIARNPEWLRPLVGVTPRGGHFLHMLAFEVGRSPDGSWFVLGDRTQAPSGAGFALENRVATSRVFSDFFAHANVQRLAGFFRGFRDAMNGMTGGSDGRVAILTPGSHTDTYYEHAYIARYLGFLLLECEDLKVDHGQLMVRTISGPRPISVLWRRLDAAFADPLELDARSQLGTPGMVGAIRAGTLTMANALGSGVLETRALLAFLPAIARKLLGGPLLLPNIATWWCGQPTELAHVKAQTAQMMVGPALSTSLPFEIDDTTALGGAFRGEARSSVEAWLDEEAPNLVGQQAVTLSTTPAWEDGRLVPRPMTVRVFAARTPQGWTVMPGGYARIGRTEDATALAMRNGGSVADVWIVSDHAVATDSLAHPAPGAYVRRSQGTLPSRAADNLFWLGRYMERGEGLMRQMRCYHLRMAETGLESTPLLDHLGEHLTRSGADLEHPIPPQINEQVEAAVGCAGKVRDRFSIDGWLALRDLAKTVRWMEGSVQPGDDAARAMSVLLRKTAGFTGLVHENMYRFFGWRFLSIGRALERADRMCVTLAGLAAPDAPEGSLDVAVEIGDSVMTHKRRFSVETNRNTVIDLLALDSLNPRSVLFQLSEVKDQIAMLPNSVIQGEMSPLSRQVLQLHTDLAVLTPDQVTPRRLLRMRVRLAELSDGLTAAYLT
ncbi:circularly permuted type 2 ATP-grasp protein [Frigidibacter sp. ROC022]|uniref:circularly permuted type 2 ATP-grasp protein n=1 Tax=Frigidibacter sp. ROC022 TaxID=2971796 RepID=UPI00215B486F|nr:circularly permuted type 2 ATP-grasp protein [Frigidibacter sp. ROC022]MCR8725406.1 circularly permuted type 2 ATP-grasp protein [Frigidibacter sp. ROC022]